MGWQITEGDCVEAMAAMPEGSVDAVVCDPPYMLSFMGRSWDSVSGHGIDPAFMHWFAGFVDGEGCFSVHKKPQATFDCQFSISLRADDRPILERIQRTLQMGTLSKPTAHRADSQRPGAKPQARYSISAKADCVRLRDLLRAFPLRAKKARDFELWSDALDAWLAHGHGDDWGDMEAARDVLMASRDYVPEGVRVDPQQMWHWRWAREALRVLKPGGHCLAFGGTRTYHRLASGLEDAGFEIRDSVSWIFGSGFPKSLDVSKAIDKRPGVGHHREFALHLAAQRAAAGLSRADVSERVVGTRSGACWNWEHHQFPEAKWWDAIRSLLDLDPVWGDVIAEAEREKVGERDGNLLAVAPGQGEDRSATVLDVTADATPEAEQWSGWGTALKPAHEPIVVARKPLVGTVAGNVLAHSTGALNVDGCRVETSDRWEATGRQSNSSVALEGGVDGSLNVSVSETHPEGRWPANVALDPEAADMLDAQTGETSFNPAGEFGKRGRKGAVYGAGKGIAATVTEERDVFGYGDSGGASRFFYVAKASRAERNAGLDGFDPKMLRWSSGDQSPGTFQSEGTDKTARNHHPTVKPIALMRWLVRLVTPPGGTVLDPFTGSGTTGCAAVLEGFDFIGCERDPEYLPIAKARIAWWVEHPEGVEIVKALEAEAVRRKIADSGQIGFEFD